MHSKKTSLASKWIFLHYFICFAYSMHSKKNIPCKQVDFSSLFHMLRIFNAFEKKHPLQASVFFLHYFICFAYSMHSKKNIPCKQVFFFFIIFYILFSVKYGIIEMCMVGVVWPFFREDVRFLSHGFMYDETEDFGSC